MLLLLRQLFKKIDFFAYHFCEQDELVCHFRDYHLPVGCLATDSEVLDVLAFSSEDKDVSAAVTTNDPATSAALSQSSQDTSQILRCFICCLKFTNRESLEHHLQYHKVKYCCMAASGQTTPFCY